MGAATACLASAPSVWLSDGLPPLDLWPHTHSTGESEVDYCRRRLPLIRLLGKPGLGRALRAITLAVESLSKDDDSKGDSNQLRRYESRCRLASEMNEKC